MTSPCSQTSRLPAASWWTPRNALRGGRGPQRVNTSSIPSRVGLGLDHPRGEERFRLRPEDDRPVAEDRVVERAHPEAVAHQRQAPVLGLPPGERELAVQAIERAETVELEQPQDDLGVGRRRERLAARLAARPAARGGCRPRRCRRSGRRRAQFSIGCQPPGMSKIARREETRPAPWSSASPKPSGPRWRIERAIRRSVSSGTGGPASARTMPAMPHKVSPPRGPSRQARGDTRWRRAGARSRRRAASTSSSVSPSRDPSSAAAIPCDSPHSSASIRS